MADIKLSEGAIRAFETNNSDKFRTPILQIATQIKEITSSNAGAQKQTRYRSIVTDGVGNINVFFATQLNPLIESKQIDKFSVLQINQYQVNPIKEGKLLLIILETQVLANLDYKLAGGQSNQQKDSDAISSINTGVGQVKPEAVDSKPNFTSLQQDRQTNPYNSNNAANFNQRSAPPAQSGGGFSSMPIAQAHNGPAPTIFEIKHLNPYQNRWTIRARVSQKSDIKTWNNQKGSGRLFNVTFMDESGEIRATGFNEQLDQFYGMLEVGKVYYVSAAKVNIANPKFNKTKNEYELSFESNTVISLCNDSSSVPQVKYSFVKLNSLGERAKDDSADVLTVVIDVGELSSIKTKATNKTLLKRELTVVDESMYSVRLTLWGADAENYGYNDNPVIAFQDVRIGDFGGRTLSMMFNSNMIVNPDIPEAFKLRSWYDSEGKNASFKTYSGMAISGGVSRMEDSVKTIEQVKEEALGSGDKADYYALNATIVYIRQENMAYPACPAEGCNKKVILENGQWRCENCQRSYPNPEYRYIFSMNVSDHTGNLWVQCFNETGNQVLGIPANEMWDYFENNKAIFDAKIAKANFNLFQLKCRAKSETYNDTTRVKHVAVSANPLNYASETKRLYDIVKGFSQASI